ncbi:hypothetical protein [Methylomonas sp. MgM2]
MKTSEFARYIHMEIVGQVFILDKSADEPGFEIHVVGITGEYDKYMANHGRCLELSAGVPRRWKDLDKAYDFILESGWVGKVFIECDSEKDPLFNNQILK